MPIIIDNTLNLIRSIAMGGDDRATKAKRLADRIQKLGEYRWVGVYDVVRKSSRSSPGADRARRSIRRFRRARD